MEYSLIIFGLSALFSVTSLVGMAIATELRNDMPYNIFKLLCVVGLIGMLTGGWIFVISNLFIL